MGRLVGTVQLHGFFKIIRSKLNIALALMAIASVDVGRCIARLKGQGLIEVLQCLLVLMLVVSWFAWALGVCVCSPRFVCGHSSTKPVRLMVCRLGIMVVEIRTGAPTIAC